jgi:WD40 repeat protein
MALSPAGDALASFSADNMLRVWDIRTGRARFVRYAPASYGESPVFSTDGQFIAIGVSEGVQWWDVSTGQQSGLPIGHEGRVHRVDISADGTFIAYASQEKADPTVRVWNQHTRKEVLRVSGETDYAYPVALTRDGSFLSVGTHDGTVLIYDVKTGTEIRRFKAHESGVRSLTFSPNGTLLASGGNDKTAGLWDVASGSLLHRLRGHNQIIPSVTFSPDGSRLATGSYDTTVRLWDVASGEERRCINQPSPTEIVVFSRDGKRLYSGNQDGGIHVWDAFSGEELMKRSGHDGAVHAVAALQDGATLASAGSDRVIRLWDIGLRKERVALKGHTGTVTSLSLSPNGNLIASGAEDQSIRIWGLPLGQVIFTLRGTQESDFVHSLAFSPNGDVLAVGSTMAVRIWKATSGELESTLQEASEPFPLGSSAVAFSSDGRWLAWSAPQGVIRIRDLRDGKEHLRLTASQRSVDCLAFSPSSVVLASAGFDRVIRLWDSDKGKELSHSDPCGSTVGSLVFSPSGSLLAAGEHNGAIRLLETWSGGEIRKWEGGSGSVRSLCFVDERTLASGNANSTIVLWDVSGVGAYSQPEQPVDTESAWQELASKDCSRAFRAMRRLVAIPRQSIPFLKEHARPISEETIRRCASQLDVEEAEVRTGAFNSLALAAGEIQVHLEKLLSEKPATEAQVRISSLLTALKPPHITSPGRLRVTRIVQVLEWIGTPESQVTLEEISKRWGPSFESNLCRAAVLRLTIQKRK